MKTFKELMDEFGEAVKKAFVVRKGKKIKKKISTKTGYKMQGGKEVKMDAKEKMKRKKGAKIAARKSKSKKGIAAKKRLKSLKKGGHIK